jgi:photosystem II stability/assembly factor-like uncharacterized protein
MKRLLLIACAVLICVGANAWDLVRQASFPANFYGLDVVGNQIWAVGSGGAVAKSVDGGQSWIFVETPFFNAVTATYRTVEDVSFADLNHGVAVGGMGIVAITSDGGANWTYPASAQAVIGTTELKSAVYHADGKIWVCGSSGMIAYSPDHGATWSLQTSPISTILYGMSMNTDGIGFIACNKGTPSVSKILKTNDFGATWTIENFTIGDNPSIYNVRQFGSKVVLVGDFGYLGYSNDNGTTWTHHSYAAGTSTNDELHDVVMNGEVGYAVGWYHGMLSTTDGWATFSPVVHDFTSSHLEQVVQNSNGDLVAAGWQGTLAVSINGGVSWLDSVPSSVDLWQASIVDANTWFIAADKGNVFKTTDGGQTLVKKKIPGFIDILYACYFKNANEGFISGKTSGKIYRTIDGGDTWTDFTVPGFSATKSYYEFFFLNDLTGYVLGVGGKVAKTTDGGLTWTLTGDNINTAHNLYSAYWKSETNGYAGSGSGLLYITTNSGVTWTSITVGGSSNIRDIWFRNADNGVLVKENGEIFYTTTGGNTTASWIAALDGATAQVNGVMCDHNGVYWAAGYSTEASQQGNSWSLMKSLDNGATWHQESFPALTFNPTRFLSIGTGGGKIVAVGRNNVVVAQLEIPEHVTLTSPPDNSPDLNPASVTLQWTPSEQGSSAQFYQVFLSDSEDNIFDGYYFETPDTSFNLSAAAQNEGFSLGYETQWFWAIMPVNQLLDSPDPASDDFMIWRFTTMADPIGDLEVPLVNIERVNNSVRLWWPAVPNAMSYKVFGSVDPSAAYGFITQTTATEWIITTPGAMEFFKVVAVNE